MTARSPQQHEYVDLLNQLDMIFRQYREALSKADKVWWSMNDQERDELDRILSSSPHEALRTLK